MNKSIQGIYDDDLINFLKSIDEYKKIEKNIIKCRICSDLINIDNISLIYPDSGQIRYICNKPSCLETYMSNIGS